MHFGESEVEYSIPGSCRSVRRKHVNRRLLFPLFETIERFAASSAVAVRKILHNLPNVLGCRGGVWAHHRPESDFTSPYMKDAQVDAQPRRIAMKNEGVRLLYELDLCRCGHRGDRRSKGECFGRIPKVESGVDHTKVDVVMESEALDLGAIPTGCRSVSCANDGHAGWRCHIEHVGRSREAEFCGREAIDHHTKGIQDDGMVTGYAYSAGVDLILAKRRSLDDESAGLLWHDIHPQLLDPGPSIGPQRIKAVVDRYSDRDPGAVDGYQ